MTLYAALDALGLHNPTQVHLRARDAEEYKARLEHWKTHTLKPRYREAIYKAHPDRGGNVVKAAVINDALKVLKGLRAEWEEPATQAPPRRAAWFDEESWFPQDEPADEPAATGHQCPHCGKPITVRIA